MIEAVPSNPRQCGSNESHCTRHTQRISAQLRIRAALNAHALTLKNEHENTALMKRVDVSSTVIKGRPETVKEEWIEDAEKKLARKLPSSYKWWLLSYGCGWIDGYPIYTLAPPEFREGADSDIVTANLAHKKNGIADDSRLYFYEPDGDERYFLDASQEPVSEEYPVMLESLTEGTTTEYAPDFGSFLKKIIGLRATPNKQQASSQIHAKRLDEE